MRIGVYQKITWSVAAPIDDHEQVKTGEYETIEEAVEAAAGIPDKVAPEKLRLIRTTTLTEVEAFPLPKKLAI